MLDEVEAMYNIILEAIIIMILKKNHFEELWQSYHHQ
jgi:hypothetical protein